MDNKDKKEIKKDLKSLDEYLKSDKGKYYTEYANQLVLNFTNAVNGKTQDITTPARINRKDGVIEVSKKYFMPDEGSVDYHKMKLRHTFITSHEILHISHHLKQGINITKGKLLEWIEYADKELKQFNNSQDALIKAGHLFKKDNSFANSMYLFKEYLFKKYWWKLGWFGIKERLKILIKWQ